MPELQEALRAYGERLAELVDDEGTTLAEPRGSRGGRHRVVLVAACIAILGAFAALVARRDEPVELEPPAGEDTPADLTGGGLAGAWIALPTQLGNGDSEPALLVTDDGLINLHPENGGNDVAGEIWAVGAEETTPLAPSGMGWRVHPSVAWTGTEVVMAGGSNDQGVAPLAAAYDPATEQWRELPDPPGIATGQTGNVTDGVWTGSELISWSSGLAYEPPSESWRSIEPSPLSERSWAAVTATDEGVFVWGGCSPLPTSQCDEVSDEDELTDGALYDPQTDSWRRVSSSPLGPGDHPTAVWTGKEVIVNVPSPVDPDAPDSAAYDPSTDRWRALPDSPHPAARYTEAVWTGRFLVIHGGVRANGTPSGATSLLDLEREQWHRLPDGPPRGPHSMVAIDPTSVIIAGGYTDASPWLLEFDEPE